VHEREPKVGRRVVGVRDLQLIHELARLIPHDGNMQVHADWIVRISRVVALTTQVRSCVDTLLKRPGGNSSEMNELPSASAMWV